MKRFNKKKGFTLVELLVVVAIIAILVLIAIPRFSGSTDSAKLRTFEGNMRTIASQVVQYQSAHGGSVKGLKDDTSFKEFLTSIQNKPGGATYTASSDNEVTGTLDFGNVKKAINVAKLADLAAKYNLIIVANADGAGGGCTYTVKLNTVSGEFTAEGNLPEGLTSAYTTQKGGKTK